MQANRFVTLTGHLSNYPLSDLVGILRHQRKSGRLTIEYPKGPAIFFFHDGELVDAQLNDLTGLQAVCVALSQPESSFNFNPLIRPSRRSIEPANQRVVSELLGCWDESAFQIEGSAVPADLPPSASYKKPESLLPQRAELLLLPAAPASLTQRRSLLFVAAVGLLMLGLSTVIAVSGSFNSAVPSAEASKTNSPLVKSDADSKSPAAVTQKHVVAASEPLKLNRASEQLRRQNSQTPTLKQEPKTASTLPEPSTTSSATAGNGTYQTAISSASSVKVILQIENGRVLKAAIANHKSGMDSYEALALRIARQRRYPPKQTGQETVKIDVTRPN